VRIIERASPNFDARGRDVDTVILHYTGMKTGAEAIERLCSRDARVSAHYVVEEDGRIFRLVDEEARAWHAGVSSWKGESDINARSIGIEIVNPGHEWGYRDFPAPQVDAAAAVVAEIAQRRAISPARVLAHSDVAPARKEDPGEKFPWSRLAARGLAIGPYAGGADAAIAYDDAIRLLREIGYEVPDTAPGKPGPAAAVLAFQRRFCPADLGRGMSPLTKAAIAATAAAFRAA
jgi:N-acetylmuramoyl-L-alanine amidase